jgi:TatD DNase family protein
MYIDTHCHLFYEDFIDDLDDVIRRSVDAGVHAFIVPATNHSTARRAIDLSEQYDNLFVGVGFHPLDLEHFSDEHLAAVEQMIGHPKVVAVGEIGIDYFYDRSPREFQQETFARQIDMAVRHNMPIIVHTRDSVDDAVEIALRYASENPGWKRGGKRGVFHCFTGDVRTALRLFEQGFLISFPGPVTFKKSAMPSVIKEIGLKNIMIETDAPFLTPIPFRGKRNEPAYIPLIAQFIAETLDVSVEEVARQTTANAVELFSLKIQG